jgi:UDP-N-acetylglucosamine 2-epimerase
LVGSNTQKIVATARAVIGAKGIKSRLEKLRNPFGNGRASQKIVAYALRRR